MKTKIILCTLLLLIVNAYGQNDSILKYTYNKENIVASAIEGSWESEKTKDWLAFKKDTTILELLSSKYYNMFRDKTIYHAGQLSIMNDRRGKKDALFILIEANGNPCILIFEEKDSDPWGRVNGGYLFIAKGNYKSEDKLILAGDHSTDSAVEYVRIE